MAILLKCRENQVRPAIDLYEDGKVYYCPICLKNKNGEHKKDVKEAATLWNDQNR